MYANYLTADSMLENRPTAVSRSHSSWHIQKYRGPCAKLMRRHSHRTKASRKKANNIKPFTQQIIPRQAQSVTSQLVKLEDSYARDLQCPGS